MLKQASSQQLTQIINQIPTNATETLPDHPSHDSSSINLFHLQANYQQPPQKCQSKNFRRVVRKKTPSDVIKDGLLRSRQSRRESSLKCITAQNIKIFLRLQGQKSAYQLSHLHRELSSALPLNSSKCNRLQEGSAREMLRCSSATTLKTRCASLRHLLTNPSSRNSTPRQQTENLQFGTSNAASKVSLWQDKENRGSNIIPSSRQLNKNTVQTIIFKKMGIKVPIDQVSMGRGSKQLGSVMPPRAARVLGERMQCNMG